MNHVLIRGWIHFTGSNLESGHLQYLRAELLLATAASISAFKLPARSSSSFVRSYSTEASKHGCVKDKEGQSERGRERARAREREREREGGREGGREGERQRVSLVLLTTCTGGYDCCFGDDRADGNGVYGNDDKDDHHDNEDEDEILPAWPLRQLLTLLLQCRCRCCCLDGLNCLSCCCCCSCQCAFLLRLSLRRRAVVQSTLQEACI